MAEELLAIRAADAYRSAEGHRCLLLTEEGLSVARAQLGAVGESVEVIDVLMEFAPGYGHGTWGQEADEGVEETDEAAEEVYPVLACADINEARARAGAVAVIDLDDLVEECNVAERVAGLMGSDLAERLVEVLPEHGLLRRLRAATSSLGARRMSVAEYAFGAALPDREGCAVKALRYQASSPTGQWTRRAWWGGWDGSASMDDCGELRLSGSYGVLAVTSAAEDGTVTVFAGRLVALLIQPTIVYSLGKRHVMSEAGWLDYAWGYSSLSEWLERNCSKRASEGLAPVA